MTSESNPEPVAEPVGSVNGASTDFDGGADRFLFDADDHDGRLTHQLFRFPAKFHPPVARRLIADYTKPGDLILDPFCGSGTLLVEASVSDRNALGLDVDPLAVFLSSAKSQAIDVEDFRVAAEEALLEAEKLRRDPDEYKRLMHEDLTEDQTTAELRGLSVPAIPRLNHWFRRYVVVDLARLLHALREIECDRASSELLELVFAASIRGSSNADPVPVSGLERTSHMLRRDEAGRLVDPFAIFRRRLLAAVRDVGDYSVRRSPDANCVARWADATEPFPLQPSESVDAVITSPPYHGAVDYYRRHQLEMFWLGFTESQEDRLRLLDRYVGRPAVPQRHRFVQNMSLSVWPKAAQIEARIRATSGARADQFRHYCVAIARTLKEIARVLPEGSPAVMVVGHSRWNGEELGTSDLVAELAGPHLELENTLWYPVKNRHMSYGRHNGANIDREFVLVLRSLGGGKLS